VQLLQIAAFVNENNLKNATAFFTSSSVRKTALNKVPLFCLYALMLMEFLLRDCEINIDWFGIWMQNLWRNEAKAKLIKGLGVS